MTNQVETTTTEAPAKQMSKTEIAMRIRVREIVKVLEEASQADALTDWEKTFCADMAKRFGRYGLAVRLSGEQFIRMEYLIAKAAAH